MIYTGKHKSGKYYEFIGIAASKQVQHRDRNSLTLSNNILTLAQVEEIEKRVLDICKEYGLNNSTENSVEDLFREDYEVFYGDNRSR